MDYDHTVLEYTLNTELKTKRIKNWQDFKQLSDKLAETPGSRLEGIHWEKE